MDFLETDTQALAAFTRGQAFLVAGYLVAPHLERLQALVRKPLKEKNVLVGDFPAKAYLFPKTVLDGRRVRDVLFGTDGKPGVLGIGADAVDVSPAQYKGCTVPYVYGREPKAELLYKEEKDLGEEEKMARKNAATSVHRLAQRFSRITGMRLKLHLDGSGTRAPMPDEPGLMHLFTGADPPGEQDGYVYRNHLFGIQLHKDLHFLHFRSGAKGRGRLLSVTDGLTETRFAQILGSNLYVLFPVVSVYWEPSMPAVFCKVLGRAYEALLDGTKDAETVALAAPTPDDEAFTAAVSDAITLTAEYWKKKVKEEEATIEAKRKELLASFGNLREWHIRLKACSEKSFYTDTLDRLPKDRTRILAMPEVERLTAVDSGVNVYTKPLEMEWKGKRHPLGRFAIRVGKYGGISVWGVESTHPEGVPHPHIAKDGGPCFGNATDAITLAAADFRVADVVSHIIAWLTRGYTPELAEHKIEEWAAVPERKKTCRSTSRTNGRSSRRSSPSP